jgi:hypothetical protein
MDRKRMKEFLDAQRVEIERHKWIESEKAGHDLGEAAVQDWINRYAKTFREEYENEHRQN